MNIDFDMLFDEIDDIITDTMIEHGPDGHCDGHEIITTNIIDFLKSKLELINNSTEK